MDLQAIFCFSKSKSLRHTLLHLEPMKQVAHQHESEQIQSFIEILES